VSGKPAVKNLAHHYRIFSWEKKFNFPLSCVSFGRSNKYGIEKETAAERKRKEESN
jgi:hypothetical protein